MSVKTAGLAVVGIACTLLVGCRSPHVEITVVNHTGEEARLLEVDYPSASFGADSLAAGGTLHYRVALQGNSAIKVQYNAPGNILRQATGPSVAEGQNGRLEIDLLPGGKAEFHPELQSAK
jgi:hypothetical protein